MKCPNCGAQCERDEVDVGVGNLPLRPYGCPECHWIAETFPCIPVFVDPDVEERVVHVATCIHGISLDEHCNACRAEWNDVE